MATAQNSEGRTSPVARHSARGRLPRRAATDLGRCLVWRSTMHAPSAHVRPKILRRGFDNAHVPWGDRIGAAVVGHQSDVFEWLVRLPIDHGGCGRIRDGLLLTCVACGWFHGVRFCARRSNPITPHCLDCSCNSLPGVPRRSSIASPWRWPVATPARCRTSWRLSGTRRCRTASRQTHSLPQSRSILAQCSTFSGSHAKSMRYSGTAMSEDSALP
jgi:hypothetical protein